MSLFETRLEAALKHAKKKPDDLVKHFVTGRLASRQAVLKWFTSQEKEKNLKMGHLFEVADFCGVDPRWLGTGKGSMVGAGKPECTHTDIPQRRIDLIRMYGRLPDEIRLPIRQLIETLSWNHHPNKSEYVKRQRRPEMVHDE